jgi:hypothetical protein
MKQAVAAVPEQRRRIITSHDAFGYFGAAHGLHSARGRQHRERGLCARAAVKLNYGLIAPQTPVGDVSASFLRPASPLGFPGALLLESFEQLWAPCHYTVDLRHDSSPLANR